jgi:hypothetical protein
MCGPRGTNATNEPPPFPKRPGPPDLPPCCTTSQAARRGRSAPTPPLLFPPALPSFHTPLTVGSHQFQALFAQRILTSDPLGPCAHLPCCPCACGALRLQQRHLSTCLSSLPLIPTLTNRLKLISCASHAGCMPNGTESQAPSMCESNLTTEDSSASRQIGLSAPACVPPPLSSGRRCGPGAPAGAAGLTAATLAAHHPGQRPLAPAQLPAPGSAPLHPPCTQDRQTEGGAGVTCVLRTKQVRGDGHGYFAGTQTLKMQCLLWPPPPRRRSRTWGSRGMSCPAAAAARRSLRNRQLAGPGGGWPPRCWRRCAPAAGLLRRPPTSFWDCAWSVGCREGSLPAGAGAGGAGGRQRPGLQNPEGCLPQTYPRRRCWC